MISVGIHSISNPDPWSIVSLTVSKVISNPNYNMNTESDDLALIKLRVISNEYDDSGIFVAIHNAFLSKPL